MPSSDVEKVAQELYEQIMRLGITKQGNLIPGVIAQALSASHAQGYRDGLEKAAELVDHLLWENDEHICMDCRGYYDPLRDSIPEAIRKLGE